VKKELRPTHELLSCEVCQHTILKGERTEAYLAPGGQRHFVCELCLGRAEREGWIRESAHAEQPATRRGPEPKRSVLERLSSWLPAPANERDTEGAPEEDDAARALPDPSSPPDAPAEEAPMPSAEESGGNGANGAGVGDRLAAPFRSGPRRSARPVRAVPTNAQVKVERALEVFNASEHRRTVAGLARTLGEPWVSAQPSTDAGSEVSVVVAWELSWYQFRVDLGDAHDPVSLVRKGHELSELEDTARVWNGAVAGDGGLMAAQEARP